MMKASEKAVMDFRQRIADGARHFREMNPEIARKIEEKVKQVFEHHMGMVLGRGRRELFHDVFALTKVYKELEPRFSESGTRYVLTKKVEGLFHNRASYFFDIPKEQYVVIDTVLSLANQNHAAASLSWLVLSPADQKAAARGDDGEPIWFGSAFTQRAMTFEQGIEITLSAGDEVWFGICFEFAR